MKFKSILLAALPVVFLTAVSCSDDDSVSGPSYQIPTSYTFERNGQTSVDYTGQVQRIKMLAEFDAYSKNKAGFPTFDGNLVSNMFSNTSNPFADQSLNTSGKQLRDKTASSADYFSANSVEAGQVKVYFDNYFTELGTVAESYDIAAVPGAAGSIEEGKRLVNGKGLEINQAIIKGLMGACFLDQALNNYLSTTVLDQTRVANDAGTLEEGKNYTTMEHKWDEAYGYIFGHRTTNADGTPKLYFWESYLNTVNGNAYFEGITEEIRTAFIKGRAAITNKDYQTRDEQIDIIREKMSVVGAVRAVFYLNEGKALLSGDPAQTVKGFHALSEAYGFITGLRYTHNPQTNAPYFSAQEVNAMHATLLGGTNGFWDATYTSQKADELMATIAQRFGFTVEVGIDEGGSH
ncbi:hypothetical protein VF13_41505 [Nostoc linckia z16]|nr:hypothetical protein VF13_41505 [Nostoc linckia z16]